MHTDIRIIMWFLGSVLIRWLRDQTWLCVFCWCQTPEGLCRTITRAQPCYHVILVAGIAVASIPGRENARASFCGRLSVWDRTASDRCHLLPMATTKLIMRCIQKLNFRCPLSTPMKMASSTKLWYICASAGRYDFQWDRLLGEFGFWSSGSSLVSRWRDAPLVREFKMWRRRCKKIVPHWFQARRMRFWSMWLTTS